VTARTGEPHGRVDLAERVLVTWLVLDGSVSMQFGTADRRKVDVSEGVAVAIGHLATRRGNRLGVVSFGGAESTALPPRQGRIGLIGLLAALRSEPPAEGPGRCSAGARRPGACTSALARRRRVRLRGDRIGAAALGLRGTTTSSPWCSRSTRAGAVGLGLLYLVDPETGRQLRVDTGADACGAVRRRRGRRARRAGPDARLGRGTACRPLDLGRLAPPARHVLAQEPGVRFDWPLALVALAVLPVLVALYVDRDRRRVASQARFGNPDLLPNVVDRSPGRLRTSLRSRSRGARLPDRRSRTAARDRQGQARGSDDHPRDDVSRR
jgi:hypothetical protein